MFAGPERSLTQLEVVKPIAERVRSLEVPRVRHSIKQVVTFAAPRSGDGAFQTGYQSVFKNHIRYENYGDLVPLLPPSDEFVGLLAKAVGYIPDIGPDLSKLISEAAGWDYTPVGAQSCSSKARRISIRSTRMNCLWTSCSTSLGT